MNKWIPTIGFIVASFLVLVPTGWALHLPEGGPYMPIGERRSLELKDFDGKPHKVEEYTKKGKWLIVMIWASDCHVCNKEAVHYVALHERQKNKNISLLGISIDGWDNILDAEAFVDRHKITFPNLIGSLERVETVFRHYTGGELTGTPTFLIFSPDKKPFAAQAGAVPVAIIEQLIVDNAKKFTK